MQIQLVDARTPSTGRRCQAREPFLRVLIEGGGLDSDLKTVDLKAASGETTDVIYQRTLIQNLRNCQRSRSMVPEGGIPDNQYS
jgi:hypothetical protein